MNNKKILMTLSIAGLVISTMALAETTQEDWNAKFQSTYVWQQNEAFHSPYFSVNSLSSDAHKSLQRPLVLDYGKAVSYI